MARHIGRPAVGVYIGVMRQLWIFVPLFALLGFVFWFAYYEWTTIQGPPIPGFGYLAMIGGTFFSVIIGCALIALMFYSQRHGYDDIIDHSEKRDRRD